MRPVLRRPRLALGAAATALILLASCSGAMTLKQGPSAAPPAAGKAVGAIAPAPAAPQAVAAMARSSAVAPSGGGPLAQGSSNPTVSLPNLQPASQMLIKNATVRIEAKDPTAGLDRLSQIATDLQGQLTNSQYSYQGDRLFITQTVSVPADRFGTAMTRIRALGKELGKELDENVTTQDVTEEYVDVQAQIDNLRASQRRLQELLAKTSDVNQLLAVQRELASVEGQMERLEGRAKYLDTKSAVSTIDVTFQMPPIESKPPIATGWQPADVALQSLAFTLAFWQGVLTLAIRMIIFIIPLAPFLAIAYVVWRRARTERGPRAASSAPPTSTTATP